jgi:hypothetical protein
MILLIFAPMGRHHADIRNRLNPHPVRAER